MSYPTLDKTIRVNFIRRKLVRNKLHHMADMLFDMGGAMAFSEHPGLFHSVFHIRGNGPVDMVNCLTPRR